MKSRNPFVYLLQLADASRILYSDSSAAKIIGSKIMFRYVVEDGISRREIKLGNIIGTLFLPKVTKCNIL